MRLDLDAEYLVSYDSDGNDTAVVKVFLNGMELVELIPARDPFGYYSGSEQEVITETVAAAISEVLNRGLD